VDRKQRVDMLLDHYENPRHYGALADADVSMPGGSPECGGRVTVHLKAADSRILGLSFEGDGDTITLAAASLLMELVVVRDLTLEEILELEPGTMVDLIGRDIVGRRTKNAGLALGTLKSAVREHRRRNPAPGRSGSLCAKP
jgi:nitrogen fixation NifU-like protein